MVGKKSLLLLHEHNLTLLHGAWQILQSNINILLTNSYIAKFIKKEITGQIT